MGELLFFLSLVGWCIGGLVFVGIVADRFLRVAAKRERERLAREDSARRA